MCAALARRHEVTSAQEVTSWPHDVDHSPGLSIGRVVDALKAEFPAISLSKVRYLESEGLVSPARTGSGYRKYSAADVERLRYVLTEQRDSFTPLSVIRGQLDALDAGLIPCAVVSRRSCRQRGRRFRWGAAVPFRRGSVGPDGRRHGHP